jgi:predicted aspartyl protease
MDEERTQFGSSSRMEMRRAVALMAAVYLCSCRAAPPALEQSADPQLRMLETVQEGHLCDPRALTQAVLRERPTIDAAMAQQEVNHLLYRLGCSLSGSITSPQQSASSTASAASVSAALPSSAGETVQLRLVDGVFTVPVVINRAMIIPFVLDSGAAEVQLPAEVVLTLARTGTLAEGDFIGSGSFVLANGDTLRSPRFIIREMRIGEHVIRDVAASVGPAIHSQALLGQSFLSKLPSWTLDNNRHVLVLAR